MSSFPKVPPELVHQIVSHSTTPILSDVPDCNWRDSYQCWRDTYPTLLACALVSNIWYRVSQQHLWKVVSIRNTTEGRLFYESSVAPFRGQRRITRSILMSAAPISFDPILASEILRVCRGLKEINLSALVGLEVALLQEPCLEDLYDITITGSTFLSPVNENHPLSCSFKLTDLKIESFFNIAPSVLALLLQPSLVSLTIGHWIYRAVMPESTLDALKTSFTLCSSLKHLNIYPGTQSGLMALISTLGSIQHSLDMLSLSAPIKNPQTMTVVTNFVDYSKATSQLKVLGITKSISPNTDSDAVNLDSRWAGLARRLEERGVVVTYQEY